MICFLYQLVWGGSPLWRKVWREWLRIGQGDVVRSLLPSLAQWHLESLWEAQVVNWYYSSRRGCWNFLACFFSVVWNCGFSWWDYGGLCSCYQHFCMSFCWHSSSAFNLRPRSLPKKSIKNYRCPVCIGTHPHGAPQSLGRKCEAKSCPRSCWGCRNLL